MFWGNFFAISDKDFLANYSTGPYHREIIRPNLNQTFEKLVIFVNTLLRFDNKIDQNKLNNAIDTTSFKSLQKIENVGNFGENVYS